MIKKSFLSVLVIVCVSACTKDFLKRDPLSQLSPDNSFNSENQLRLYTNSFYDILPSATDLYGETEDNVILNTVSDLQTGNRTVPVSGGGWDWQALRSINFFLNNYENGGLSSVITDKYAGLARFFRAFFYFNALANFGDVPWYSSAIATNDSTLLNKPRDSRMLVVDSILSDLNFAIEKLPSAKSVDQITRWTALAFKSRVCLFEGAFRKYHENDLFGKDSYGAPLTGWQELLQESAAAADSLMISAQYALYNSSPATAYYELFTSLTPLTGEVILARIFNAGLQVVHNANYYTIASSFGKPGLSKNLVNSYLLEDGGRFTDIPGYDTLSFLTETANRDPRLAGSIRTPGYTRIGSAVKVAPSFGSSTTGYHPVKFVTEAAHDKINGSVAPLPILRYAEALLNFAEAKAELGTLTQQDIDRSVKLLRDRVGMPNLNMADANDSPDSYLAAQYPNVTGPNKGAILEIRRERRIELLMEGFRRRDLMRWKEGALIAKPYEGMYFKGPGSYDLSGMGTADVVIYSETRPGNTPGVQYLKLETDIILKNGVNGGYVQVNPNISKKFDEARDYLNPIPLQEMILNPKLKQNPGW